MKSKFLLPSSSALLIGFLLSGCTSNSTLLTAVTNGNKTELREMLNKGVNLNETSGPEDLTPLMAASRQGDVGAVKDLIGAGANVNVQNEYGDTALTWAAGKCRPAVIQILIDNGADVNAQNKEFGSTPLMFATDCDDVASIKALLAKGANPNSRNGKYRDGWSAVYYASRAGNWEIVRLLLEAGVNVKTLDDPNAPPPPPKNWTQVQIWGKPPAKEQDFNANDALYYAAAKGVDPIVKLFIEKGVDVNFVRHWPRSSQYVPLVIAANNNHPTTVSMLLDAGADVNSAMSGLYGSPSYQVHWIGPATSSQVRSTALIVATRKGYKEIVSMLIKRGADANLADSEGKTALAYAIERNQVEIEAMLRQAGAKR